MQIEVLVILLTLIVTTKCKKTNNAIDILNNWKLEIDNEVCNAQLKYYVSSLATKEAWAMDSRIILIC